MTSWQGDAANADQVAYWNGQAGDRWASQQAVQEIFFTPITALLIEGAGAQPGERIVDVGCGCGGTTLAFAEQVGPTGHVLGVDVSEQMLARARQLTPPGAPVEFVQADATNYPFAPHAADRLVSRFGVMFFADPVRSFANLRAGLRHGGRVTFICWRAPKYNPWLMVPLQAVYRHVPKLPPVGPEEPGPFAFAAQERVERILREAGFSDVRLTPHDLSLDIAAGGGLEAAVASAVEIGPAHRALEDVTPEAHAAAVAAVRHDLASYCEGDSVRLGAAIWLVTATAP
ncbi:MAG TPA: methyltransferase domain-containing protein [Xanthobacteraceae bacterium]|nr:methyltransferase domain-containing protein [Xanthobacteraceae bacterium]